MTYLIRKLEIENESGDKMDQKIPTFSRRNELSKQKQLSCDDYEKALKL